MPGSEFNLDRHRLLVEQGKLFESSARRTLQQWLTRLEGMTADGVDGAWECLLATQRNGRSFGKLTSALAKVDTRMEEIGGPNPSDRQFRKLFRKFEAALTEFAEDFQAAQDLYDKYGIE